MHLTKIKLVWTTTALLILNLNGINTQSDTAQAATEKLVLATMSLDSVQNPTTSVIDVNEPEAARLGKAHNMNNTIVDTEKINSNETPIKQNSYAKLERPYSVIMPIKANPVNDKASPNKSSTATTKHKVEKLEVEDIKTLMQNNIHNRNNINNTVAEELFGKDHPCRRECIEREAPMICHYHFILEWYETMSKACYDCPFNETDCSRPDCIPADGVKRPLNVVNRKLPGPVIEICKYDRVIVDVENDLIAEGTTVHWHGQHQKGTPHMDGTPHVTQCSIPPKTTFRYQFNASHSGTHFWHSHSGMQRGDGAAGAFIVRKPKSLDPHGWMYDYDRSDHVMLITDWSHVLLVGMFTSYHHTNAKSDDKPPTLLINGKGRFRVFNNDTEQPKYMRAARFNVKRGYKYRFRLINAEFLNCPIELSVDGHNITVISSDGYNLKPISATSLVTYAGERYDFVLEANAGIDNYWIRYKGHMDCDERFKKAKQVAVLHYEGALDSEPPGDPTWEELHNEGLQLNALNKGEEDNETISIAEMEALEGWDESLKEVADHQFYVVYDLYPKNNPHYHRSPYYEFYQG